MSDLAAVNSQIDAPQPGAQIQRTMHLLASSTPEKRNRVRILVYGQSLSKQEWWLDVRQSLRARFPHADLDMCNLAVGGFPSQRLVHSAELDIYPEYPDLVIFRVSGDHRCYEQIVRSVRSRTSAEVLLWNDPPTWFPDGGPGDDAHMEGYVWSLACAYEIYPEIALRYGCCFADTRTEWKTYLRAARLEPHQLMVSRTDSHMNKDGNRLLGRLIDRRLYRDESVTPPDLVTLAPGADCRRDHGVFELRFWGTRVDAVMGSGRGEARVLIDGAPVSQLQQCYRFTRPNDIPGKDWPWQVGAMFRVDSRALRTQETWVATITDIAADCSTFSFQVAGSVTGPDGAGKSTESFVSRSGRVVIEPDYWFIAQAHQHSGVMFPAGHRIEWRSCLMGTDRLTVDGSGGDVTLAQGLGAGEHVVRLEGDVPLSAFRVYRPGVECSHG